MPSRFASACMGIALLGGLCAPDAGTAASVTLIVRNVEPGSTNVYAALCKGGLDRDFCKIGDRTAASAAAVTFRFANVEPGSYAAIAFQDLNGSGVLERTPLGLPLEPYALSNGAGRSGRPTFEQAALSIGEPGREVVLELRRPRAR